MSIKLTARFATRREAELTTERLVQEMKIDRAAISVAPQGDDNSVGEVPNGADDSGAGAALEGALVLSVDLADDAAADRVRAAFGEFDAADVRTDADG